MAKPRPKSVSVEFEDGTTRKAAFDSLPSQLQDEILRHPFAFRPSPDPAQEKFLVLEWSDGWKEVFQVDPGCTDVNRYYVISRPEDVGRLSLNTVSGYPELIEITRSPRDLCRIGFQDTFELHLERSSREGSKVDHFYSLEAKGDIIEEAKDAFKRVWEDEKKIPSEENEKEQIFEILFSISKKMGFKAGNRRQDLYDFMMLLAHYAKVFDA